ncbi:glutamine--fructose-6-phosphate transaminase (isomerizing) [Halobium salinum]|uniref:Glutamine--fructose-6-phosphate aminotransferase [isomerizing] n=1 Tax=Halobium salinum TaxID=1364940 RepID=A0ABD5PAN8_9EURY|nr:glutamine--fructose-6-phosphate transaminase (isomerizing) [Halobium salinum]
MCGIIARIGDGDGVAELLDALANLEYRGYDSAGIAVKGSGACRPTIAKREGEIANLRAILGDGVSGSIGIGHTRWSTHGAPSDANAHPHADCTGEVAVVHNGIIENYETLRTELESRGHAFESETDTEVVPHLVEEYREAGYGAEASFRHAIADLEGSYAIAMIVEGEDEIYATRSGSPLVLGIDAGRYYLASDVPAFLEFTDEVVYLEDGQVVVVREDGFEVSDVDGNALQPTVETVEWDAEDAGKGRYNHYMLKEINEQPEALRQTLNGRVDLENERVELEEFPEGAFEGVDEVHFVACGTSYHAAVYARQLFHDRGIPAQAFFASEYATINPPLGENTLTVAVTQSGETADTLSALRRAAGKGGRTLAVTNVVGSTAAREADDALFIRAGPEIGVAATKTFSSQVVSLAMLAERMAEDRGAEPRADAARYLQALSDLPDAIEQVLGDTSAERVASAYADSLSHFFIGRGTGHAVALEGALKFKEITYEHAEAFAAGELKHGPLALVTSETPVFAVLSGDYDEKTYGNMEEVKSRGAPVIALTDAPESVSRVTDDVITMPETHEDLKSLLANVQLQLLSYHAASLRGRAIDKPRNLAKSVTVE